MLSILLSTPLKVIFKAVTLGDVSLPVFTISIPLGSSSLFLIFLASNPLRVLPVRVYVIVVAGMLLVCDVLTVTLVEVTLTTSPVGGVLVSRLTAGYGSAGAVKLTLPVPV